MCEEDVLVKINRTDGELVSFRTYERTFGSRGRFLIMESLLHEAIAGLPRVPFYDSDCGNYVEFHKDGDYLKFTFFWFSQKSGRFFSGMKQHVAIPVDTIMETIYPPFDQTVSLCQVQREPARIDATRASRTLKRILPDKLKRNAFRKAMRDCFQWKGDTVYLSDDGGADFFFTTKSGFPSCGGLILHCGTRNGRDYIYYSVHT